MSNERRLSGEKLRIALAVIPPVVLYALFADFREHSGRSQDWLYLYVPLVLIIECFALPPLVSVYKEKRGDRSLKEKECPPPIGSFYIQSEGGISPFNEELVLHFGNNRRVEFRLLPPGDKMEIRFFGRQSQHTVKWEGSFVDVLGEEVKKFRMRHTIRDAVMRHAQDGSSPVSWPELVFSLENTTLKITSPEKTVVISFALNK